VSEPDDDRLVERWAASHASELIANAQSEALKIAQARLQARLVEALLEAANLRLAAEGGRAPDRAASGSSATLIWVYGVVADAAEPPSVPGVDGHPVQLHSHAGVSALVSQVPRERFSEERLTERLEDLEGVERLARAHDAVLEAALTAGAVVPFRLCTVYSSLHALDAMLDREGLALTAALDRLDGMQEWGVKAFLRAPAAVSSAEESRETVSGTDYLTRKRERREAAVAGREATETAVARIHARLTESASAATLSRPHERRLSGRDTEMVLNAAYLVPAEGVAAFQAIVEDLARRHEADDVDLELTGPWPPYHFVETLSYDDDA
jgi:Gas vesicle synthesis protein GvpL/GvpF